MIISFDKCENYRLVQKKITIALRGPHKSHVAAASGRARAILALFMQPGSIFCSVLYYYKVNP